MGRKFHLSYIFLHYRIKFESMIVIFIILAIIFAILFMINYFAKGIISNTDKAFGTTERNPNTTAIAKFFI